MYVLIGKKASIFGDFIVRKNPGDVYFGTAKIRTSYGLMNWSIWFGVENGHL
jgi:hypothetical protein